MKLTLSKSLITLWDCLRLWIVWGGEQTSCSFFNKSPCSIRFWFVFPWTATIRFRNSRAGIPSNLNPASKKMIFWFCWTVRNWSLFLTHPTSWTNCMTSKNAVFLLKWILNLQDLPQSQSLKQSQSALLGSITHMTILSVFTCMMNIWNQSIQAFVTSFGPFCDWSCKFIYWP